jgi:hypothetical protein
MTARSLHIDQQSAERSARRQRLVAQLHAGGPRPVLEALLEVVASKPLTTVLERFARISPEIHRAVGAERLAVDDLFVIDGGRA